MKKSYLIAFALTLAITGWMLAGHLTGGSKRGDAISIQSADDGLDRMTVEIRLHKARAVTRHIVAQGQVEPNREVTVRAETAGRVAEIVADEGQPVSAKDVLVRLEMDDRQAQLKKAQALLQERRKAYERVKQLGDKGYQAQRMIDEGFSALRAAEAELAEIQLQIANTKIRAPFAGILESRQVEVGDYVAVNGDIATIVDNDPLVVTTQIAQQSISDIKLGDSALLSFATGQKLDGTVRFIAPRAETATRTFRVEIEVPNPDSRIPSGTSAEARIPTGEVIAHFISPALLSLDATGQIGIKTVSNAGVVEFHPTTIVLAEAQGIWVSGLPEQARIITVGQGFVRPGEAVSVVAQTDKQASSAVAQQPILPVTNGSHRSAGVKL
jgi:multidrug efflux system membrane fusion protein